MNDSSLDNVNVTVPVTDVVMELPVVTAMGELEKDVSASAAGVNVVVSGNKRKKMKRNSAKCGVNSIVQDNVSVSIPGTGFLEEVPSNLTTSVLENEVLGGVNNVVSKRSKRKRKKEALAEVNSAMGVLEKEAEASGGLNSTMGVLEKEVSAGVISTMGVGVLEKEVSVSDGVNNVVSKKSKRKWKKKALAEVNSAMGVLEKEVEASGGVNSSTMGVLEKEVSAGVVSTMAVGVLEKEVSVSGGVNNVVSKKSKRKWKKKALAEVNSAMGVLEKEAEASDGVNSTIGVLEKEVSAGAISTMGVGVLEKEVSVSGGVNNVMSKKSKRKLKEKALAEVNSTMGVLEKEVSASDGVNSTIGVLEKEVSTGMNNTIGVLQKDVSAGVSDVVSKRKKRKVKRLDNASVGIPKTDDVEEVPVQLKLTTSPEKLNIAPVGTTMGVLEKEVSGGVEVEESKKKKRKPKRSSIEMTCLDNVSVGIPKTGGIEEVPVESDLRSSPENFHISSVDTMNGVLEKEVSGGVDVVESKKKKRKPKRSSIEMTCLDDVSVGIPRSGGIEDVPVESNLRSSPENFHISSVDTMNGVLEKEVSGGVEVEESKKKKRKPKRSSIEMTCLDNVSVGIPKTGGIEEVPVESNLRSSPENFHISSVDTMNGVLEKEVLGGVDVVESKKKKRKPKHSTVEMTCLDNATVGIPKTDALEELQVQLNLTSSCEKFHISPIDTTMGVLDKEVPASAELNDVVSKKRKRKPKRLDNASVGTPKTDVLEEVPVESNLTCSPEKLHISPVDTTMVVLEKEVSGGVNNLVSKKRKRKSKRKDMNDCSSIERTCLDNVSVKPVSGADNITLSDINNDVMANDHPVAISVSVDSNGKPEGAKDVRVIPPETSKRKHCSWSSSEMINPSLQLSQPLDTTTTLKSRRKLLILDVNGLLADIVSQCPRRFKPDFALAKKIVFKRPFCDDFLKFCFEKFDVGIWSSRTKANLTRAVELLIKNMKDKLLFCWDQSHCTNTGLKTLEDKHKPLVLKELKMLWENKANRLPSMGFYDESNTILLDDSPYKALCNPPYTALHPRPYSFADVTDRSLGPDGDIRLYLERLAEAENVQNFIQANPFGQKSITQAHPSWNFYSKIVKKQSRKGNCYYQRP